MLSPVKKMKRKNMMTSVDEVFQVIERSIQSNLNWAEKTNNAFHSIEKALELNELKNIVVELSWRYGEGNVAFQFTRKSNHPNALAIREIIPDADVDWKRRIWVYEDPELTRVMIYF